MYMLTKTCSLRHVWPHAGNKGYEAKVEEHCERIVRAGGSLATQAEHWRLKPEVSWVQLPSTAGLFTFLYLRLITSKFLYELV